MSLPRFLVEHLPITGELLLDANESRHASNVLRLKVGDEIIVFDGVGREASARIHGLNKRAIEVEIVERTDTNRELSRSLDMVVALPKGDRQKMLVDGLVQLGVTRLTPLTATRGVAQPKANAIERLKRAVVESSKQCGRNQLMQIGDPITIRELCDAERSAGDANTLALFAHPYGNPNSLAAIDSDGVRGCCTAIGPEGGFTEDECEALRDAGWNQVTLGARILRIEIASLMVASWWSAKQADVRSAAD